MWRKKSDLQFFIYDEWTRCERMKVFLLMVNPTECNKDELNHQHRVSLSRPLRAGHCTQSNVNFTLNCFNGKHSCLIFISFCCRFVFSFSSIDWRFAEGCCIVAGRWAACVCVCERMGRHLLKCILAEPTATEFSEWRTSTWANGYLINLTALRR